MYVGFRLQAVARALMVGGLLCGCDAFADPPDEFGGDFGDPRLGDVAGEGGLRPLRPAGDGDQVFTVEPQAPVEGPGDDVPSDDDAGMGDDGSLLDPLEVYLLGTVSPGSSGRETIALPSEPNRGLGSFGSSFGFGVVGMRPSDGRVVYLDRADALREFVCDAPCPLTNAMQYDRTGDANDPVLPVAACGTAGVQAFDFAPDGALYVRCRTNQPWIDEHGKSVVVPDEHALLAFHAGGLMLTGTSIGVPMLLAIRNATDARVPPQIALLPSGLQKVVDARAVLDGFVLLFEKRELETSLVVYHLGFDARLTELGTLPAVPMGTFAAGQHVLDGRGRAVAFARSEDLRQDQIVRLDARTGKAEVLYDESGGPLVQIHASKLFTGSGGGRLSPDKKAPTVADGLPNPITVDDTFDPEAVYLVGPATGTSLCGLAAAAAPEAVVLGVACADAAGAQLRPGDGRMLYQTPDEVLRTFTCDGLCQHIPREPIATATVADNDAPVTATHCPDNAVSRYAHAPDGSFVYSCKNDDDLLNEAGDPLYRIQAGERLLAAQSGGLLLISREGASPPISLAGTGAPASISGSLGRVILASRAVDGGFLIAHATDATGLPVQLAFLPPDGQLADLGAFPSPPTNLVNGRSHTLDAHGRLWQIVEDADDAADVVVVRASVGQDKADVVLEQAALPWTSLGAIGRLLSGSGGPGVGE